MKHVVEMMSECEAECDVWEVGASMNMTEIVTCIKMFCYQIKTVNNNALILDSILLYILIYQHCSLAD